VTFTGNAGWWIGMSAESFNGIYGGNHGDPTEFFARTAFGSGSNDIPDYANTPLCWVGYTSEPVGNGPVEDSDYFERWARGWSTLEAAWAGGINQRFLVVSDVCLEP